MRTTNAAVPLLLSVALIAAVVGGIRESQRLNDATIAAHGPHSCPNESETVELRHDNARLKRELLLRTAYISQLERYWTHVPRPPVRNLWAQAKAKVER